MMLPLMKNRIEHCVERRCASYLVLAAWLALCFAVAAFGAQFRPDAWYAALSKPPWTPSEQVFQPASAVLHVLMAVAAWRVSLAGWERAWRALGLFLAQLLFSALWSWLFFDRHAIDLAMIDLAVLWLALATVLYEFLPLSRLGFWLLFPYFGWVSFAAALNYTILRLQAPS